MKQQINPRPKLPKTHDDYMNTENIPDTYTRTADNGDFIIFKDWIDEAKTECMKKKMFGWFRIFL